MAQWLAHLVWDQGAAGSSPVFPTHYNINMIKNWSIISEEIVHNKWGRQLKKIIFANPDGDELDYYIQSYSSPAVCILALTPDNQVILAKQFRQGPNRVLMELPGGGVESDETPVEAITRELREEVGYEGEIEFVSQCWDDAYSEMQRYCFVAKNCIKVLEPQNTQFEIIEPTLLSLAEFRTHLRSGQLTDVEVGYLGLDHLGLL